MNGQEKIEKNNDEKAATAAKIPHVLLVAPALPLIGGQVVQAARLVENLKKEKSITVDLQPTNPQFLPALQKIKYLRTIIVSAAYIFELFKKIPRHDVVHIYSAGDTGFLISTTPAILISKLFGKKTILHYHHGGAEEHLKTWGRTALPTIKLFDVIIVPSNFLADVFAKFDLRAMAIYNTIDIKKYHFRERKNLRPVFMANRNFDALYNVGCILRAFRLIQEKYPQAQLLIAGDGAERAKLEKTAKDLQLQNVEFLGRIAQQEMPSLYDRADIYLNSPNIDNMPNSIIEAFAAGTPVVSTDAGGIPYIVEHGETGLLVAKNDSDSLAREAMRILEDNVLAKKIIVKARRECSKYDWENVRQKWLELYIALAKSSEK